MLKLYNFLKIVGTSCLMLILFDPLPVSCMFNGEEIEDFVKIDKVKISENWGQIHDVKNIKHASYKDESCVYIDGHPVKNLDGETISMLRQAQRTQFHQRSIFFGKPKLSLDQEKTFYPAFFKQHDNLYKDETLGQLDVKDEWVYFDENDGFIRGVLIRNRTEEASQILDIDTLNNSNKHHQPTSPLTPTPPSYTTTTYNTIPLTPPAVRTPSPQQEYLTISKPLRVFDTNPENEAIMIKPQRRINIQRLEEEALSISNNNNRPVTPPYTQPLLHKTPPPIPLTPPPIPLTSPISLTPPLDITEDNYNYTPRNALPHPQHYTPFLNNEIYEDPKYSDTDEGDYPYYDTDEEDYQYYDDNEEYPSPGELHFREQSPTPTEALKQQAYAKIDYLYQKYLTKQIESQRLNNQTTNTNYYNAAIEHAINGNIDALAEQQNLMKNEIIPNLQTVIFDSKPILTELTQLAERLERYSSWSWRNLLFVTGTIITMIVLYKTINWSLTKNMAERLAKTLIKSHYQNPSVPLSKLPEPDNPFVNGHLSLSIKALRDWFNKAK